jgi:Uma2 family endonuclease
MCRTAAIISSRLVGFCDPRELGNVYSEQTYQCFAHDPELVRRPDISLVVASRLSQVPEEGHVPIPPDFVVEVLSPKDRVYQFERKLLDYRRAQIKLVWEVNPKFRFIRVHQPDRQPRTYEETDTITGDPVLPEFSMLVSELLPKVSAK